MYVYKNILYIFDFCEEQMSVQTSILLYNPVLYDDK